LGQWGLRLAQWPPAFNDSGRISLLCAQYNAYSARFPHPCTDYDRYHNQTCGF
jgi:hypothetical protein